MMRNPDPAMMKKEEKPSSRMMEMPACFVFLSPVKETGVTVDKEANRATHQCRHRDIISGSKSDRI